MTERFTLLSELGRGGMGVVWKARDEETGSIVALKLLREAYADDPDYLSRFERELELARRIDSPNVVKVLGYGVRQGVPYLALEYVDGQSLRDLITGHGPYTWGETKALLAQIARGLGDAHAAGVIHRDVKPSNVLLAPDGTAKLTDFGIARGLDLTRVTATSTLLGTPAYLPPEGPEDERSDLYSLGVIGYELLTGVPPFDGKTYQAVMLAHLRTMPDLGKLPAEAQPILGWLLAKDPATRPQSAGELLAVLEGKSGVPTAPAATPTPAPPPVVPPPVVPPPVAPVYPSYPAYPVYPPAPPPYGRERGPRRSSGFVVFGAIAAVLLIASVAFAGIFLAGSTGAGPTSNSAGATLTSSPTATSTATDTPTAGPTFFQYQVKSGDTLALIAAKFNITVSELLAANPQIAGSNPTVGQKIYIPPPGYTASPAPTGTATATATATAQSMPSATMREATPTAVPTPKGTPRSTPTPKPTPSPAPSVALTPSPAAVMFADLFTVVPPTSKNLNGTFMVKSLPGAMCVLMRAWVIDDPSPRQSDPFTVGADGWATVLWGASWSIGPDMISVTVQCALSGYPTTTSPTSPVMWP